MSEDNNRNTAARHRRVQRLKKMIILALLLWMILPCALCAVLFIKVWQMGNSVKALELQLWNLTETCSSQQAQLQILNMLLRQEGGGSATVNESVPEVIVQESVSAVDEASEEEGQGSDAAGGTEQFTRKVYLTFDDGPSIYTDDILDILDRYDVKATFFVLGKEDEGSQAAMRRIVEEGHTLGMHSYSHKYDEIYASVDAFAEDFAKIQNYLYEVTGVASTVYRFPGGSSNTVSRVDMQVFADYLDSQGVEFYDWNVSSCDASRQPLSVDTLVRNSTTGLDKWETVIILMHDAASKKTTVEALPIIIENILAMENTVILPITEDTEPVQHIITENQ